MYLAGKLNLYHVHAHASASTPSKNYTLTIIMYTTVLYNVHILYKPCPKALMGERQSEQSYLQNFGLVCVSIHVCVCLTQCEYMYGYL